MSFFSETLTKCQRLKHEAYQNAKIIGGQPILPPGTFVPTCTVDGEFASTQCYPSTGYCWCVDKDGNEVSHTRTVDGEPECDRSESEISINS